MSERARLALLAIALLLFSVAVSEAALVGKGSDGKTYLSLDEEEVETLEKLRAIFQKKEKADGA